MEVSLLHLSQVVSESIEIFTDGGCSGNPGPGGWAFLIVNSEGVVVQEHWGAEPYTTNNRMELTAAVRALEAVHTSPNRECRSIKLYTDSQYLQKGINTWIDTWKRNGWKTSNKDPVKNQDLWQLLDAMAQKLPIEWQWIKGHAGNQYNERVDTLTQQAIASVKDVFKDESP
jgi:ribonuclease HI